MKIKDIMTKDVITLNENDTVEKASKLMKEHNIGSIPVCQGENVIGVITDRDITTRSIAQEQDIKNQKVRDIMTSNPVTANPNMDVHEASRIMSERQIRRLPVVENSKITGIVALGDLAVESKLNDDAGKALGNISEPSSPNM